MKDLKLEVEEFEKIEKELMKAESEQLKRIIAVLSKIEEEQVKKKSENTGHLKDK